MMSDIDRDLPVPEYSAMNEQSRSIVVSAGSADQGVSDLELSRLVEDSKSRLRANLVGLGGRRPIVIIEASNDLDSLVAIMATVQIQIAFLVLGRQGWSQSQTQLVYELDAKGFDTALLGDELVWCRGGGPSDSTTEQTPYLLSGGTTSHPRMLSIDASPAALRGLIEMYKLSGWQAEQRLLALLPLHHAAGLLPVLAATVSGCHIVLLDDAATPASTLDVIEARRIEWFCATPTHLRRMALEEDFTRQRFRFLRGVIHTAAPCDADTKRRWIECIGSQRIHEFYSSTEQIGVVFCSGDEWLRHPGSVGRGFLTRISIRDAVGRPVSPGVVGEVFLRSVARRPAMTSESRTTDGFRSIGDRGFVDSSGYLYLTGRTSDVVSIGGANVYPLQVEQALLEVDGVEDAMVIARPHTILGHILEARIIARSEPAGLIRRVKEHCRAKFPPESRAHVVSIVEALPRTEAGKIQRWKS